MPGDAVLAERQQVRQHGELAFALEMERERALARHADTEPRGIEYERRLALPADGRAAGAGEPPLEAHGPALPRTVHDEAERRQIGPAFGGEAQLFAIDHELRLGRAPRAARRELEAQLPVRLVVGKLRELAHRQIAREKMEIEGVALDRAVARKRAAAELQRQVAEACVAVAPFRAERRGEREMRAADRAGEAREAQRPRAAVERERGVRGERERRAELPVRRSVERETAGAAALRGDLRRRDADAACGNVGKRNLHAAARPRERIAHIGGKLRMLDRNARCRKPTRGGAQHVVLTRDARVERGAAGQLHAGRGGKGPEVGNRAFERGVEPATDETERACGARAGRIRLEVLDTQLARRGGRFARKRRRDPAHGCLRLEPRAERPHPRERQLRRELRDSDAAQRERGRLDRHRARKRVGRSCDLAGRRSGARKSGIERRETRQRGGKIQREGAVGQTACVARNARRGGIERDFARGDGAVRCHVKPCPTDRSGARAPRRSQPCRCAARRCCRIARRCRCRRRQRGNRRSHRARPQARRR